MLSKAYCRSHSMLLRFSKMHGLGNDLMVIDLISQHAYIQPQHIRAWSDRRQGVGFLRLALIEVPQHPDDDFSCRIFDSDGAEVDWLASDVCCVARLVADKRLISKAQMRIELRHRYLMCKCMPMARYPCPWSSLNCLPNVLRYREAFFSRTLQHLGYWIHTLVCCRCMACMRCCGSVS